MYIYIYINYQWCRRISEELWQYRKCTMLHIRLPQHITNDAYKRFLNGVCLTFHSAKLVIPTQVMHAVEQQHQDALRQCFVCQNLSYLDLKPQITYCPKHDLQILQSDIAISMISNKLHGNFLYFPRNLLRSNEDKIGAL